MRVAQHLGLNVVTGIIDMSAELLARSSLRKRMLCSLAIVPSGDHALERYPPQLTVGGRALHQHRYAS